MTISPDPLSIVQPKNIPQPPPSINLQTQLSQIKQRLTVQHPNLYACRNELNTIANQLNEDLRHTPGTQQLLSLKKEVDHLLYDLNHTHHDLWHLQEKWATAGFDQSLLTTDPQAVEFSVSSGLLYTIAMFRNEGDALADNDIDIKKNPEGKALFKVEGQWLTLEQLAHKKIFYDAKLEKFPGWNFVHPQGFVPNDPSYYSAIYSVARLSQQTFNRVRQAAATFSSTSGTSTGTTPSCVLEVMTLGYGDTTSSPWYLKNLRKNIPEHTSVRLINDKGEVFSFGPRITQPAFQAVFGNKTHLLCTANCKIPIPDYEEPRKCAEKRITYIPLDTKTFSRVAQFVNKANEGEGFRFNYARQNCTKFAQEVLHEAGIFVDTRERFFPGICTLLPDLQDVPRIGKPLTRISEKVSTATSRFFGQLSHCLPGVGKVVSRAYNGLCRIKDNIVDLSWNWAALALGGWRHLPCDTTDPRSKEDSLANENRLTSFTKLVRGWNILNPHLLDLGSSHKMRDWQLSQKSTYIFRNCTSSFRQDPASGQPVASLK